MRERVGLNGYLEGLTKFGFEPQMVVLEPNGTIAHAELSLGPRVIMIGTAKDDERGTPSAWDLPAVNHGLNVYVPNADAHYDRARAAIASTM